MIVYRYVIDFVGIALTLSGVSMFIVAQWYYGHFGWSMIPQLFDIAGTTAILAGLIALIIPIFRKDLWI